MVKLDLNKIPDRIKTKEITAKEAINLICSFLSVNYRIFGLQHYDEDFREELILQILEKGEKIILNYKEQQGDFFNYIFCYIVGTARTLVRTKAKKKILESVAFSEHIKNLEEKEYKYNHINYSCFDSPKIPYAHTKITPEDLRSSFAHINKDKELLIIAMKSAFYLTDQQIKKICNYYNLDKKDFYKTIEYYRSTLMEKSKRKQEVLDRRNHAYYNHKKCEKQLELLKYCDLSEDNIIQKNHLLKKDQKQYNSWKNLTNQLKNGLLSVRPSNKIIAEILGICERQVIYYIKRAKKRIAKENDNTVN